MIQDVMARKKSARAFNFENPIASLPSETKRAVLAIVLFLLGAILTLAALGKAGVFGDFLYLKLGDFLGAGYFLVPLISFLFGIILIRNREEPFPTLKAVVAVIFFTASLGFVELISGEGGALGKLIETPVVHSLDVWGGGLLLGAVVAITLIVIFEASFPNQLSFGMPKLPKVFGAKSAGEEEDDVETAVAVATQGADTDEAHTPMRAPEPMKKAPLPIPEIAAPEAPRPRLSLEDYQAPPISLLEHDKGKPGVGDIKANANLIKRTLQNFGIIVELDEISIGPSVTRYAIKPAEGVRLSKIVALQQNLALALAAKGGIRIEAPIPGKSLVGIEVPNTAKTTVGLASLFSSDEFEKSGKSLLVGLGRDIGGLPHFGNVAKMPHLLIAGATGSGKSVTIHTLINSLLYRNGPQTLRFLMIDPKRVELTLYNKIPHLLSPVITDAKKAIMALRWAAKEMDRRYNILEAESVRDISSYHENVLGPALESLRKKGKVSEGEQMPEAMPYIVIVIDELADIMQTYPRELEAAIVRLAQMSRAVGIHLMLSTQRPSVNVITGLIKANVPARLALQVASQIDSRTILDQGGAETLLGAGDMLYLSGDMSKPIRLQSAYISEGEVKKVVDYIAKNNPAELPVVDLSGGGSNGSGGEGSPILNQSLDDDDDIDDDLYEAARAEVLAAGKASTSYLQRKLKVGYARAARIVDVLEARGVIGPADGAKPREVIGSGTGRDEEQVGS
jgi:S-DNA-T family DNA segregation ATPase FtsK/SpoIIIE